jgi:23S rRNA (adenine2503-C2)-methyltransferase
MFNGNAMTLAEIGHAMECVPKPVGRKITLNFAIADYEINPAKLLKYFSPENYVVKLTPMHKTPEAIANGIVTSGDYTCYTPYQEYERELKAAGYDVLVFLASEAEDMSRITCGNAILSGSKPEMAKP